MAPLISMLDEAADWLDEIQSGTEQAFLRPPISWEWLTVAVFTCAQDCATSTMQHVFAEATVAIANE